MPQYAGMPEEIQRYECGCRKVWTGYPVAGWHRYWSSECTDPDHAKSYITKLKP